MRAVRTTKWRGKAAGILGLAGKELTVWLHKIYTPYFIQNWVTEINSELFQEEEALSLGLLFTCPDSLENFHTPLNLASTEHS